MSLIYVTGHRVPDTDSIGSAVGYAELKQRLDPSNEYVPVRLGDPNAQTRWVLDRSGAPTPDFLPHVMLRVRDVMRREFPTARRHEPVRDVGLAMAKDTLDLVPIIEDDGVLAGVMTVRDLARRYIRESREASSLGDASTTVRAVVHVLEGEVVAGEDQEITGRIWVSTMAIGSSPAPIGPGDVMVVGDRPDAQRRALELGVSLLVAPNSSVPSEEILELARERGTTVVVSPLDAYVTARMISLASPCEGLMDPQPLTVTPDDLVADIADQIKDVHYGAAIAVDEGNRPGRARRPLRHRRSGAATRSAGRSRRARPECAGSRRGRHRRDPRSPPHRFDRNALSR